MTTAQIIILTVFTILSFGSIIRLGFLSEEKETFIIALISYSFILIVAITSLALLNKLHSKCPEYERIENVYKLKQ